MTLCLIVAVAENGVIGRDNDLPWRLSGDLKRFKSLTMGKPLIMGRKTYESIGRPLPGRTSIVLTRDDDFTADGVLIARDQAAAMALAEQTARTTGVEEIMVIGGAGIYRLFLPDADRLYLTEVHMASPGDTYFPDINARDWMEISRERHDAEAGESCDYSFVVLDRARRTDA
jgi:dihydrofolate reductase